MDVKIGVLGVLLDKFLCLVERLLEGPRVMPCKEGCIRLRIKVVKRVRKGYIETIIFIFPLTSALAALPLHRVRLNAVDWP